MGVAGVEAAHEAHHGHQVRVLARHGFHGLAGGHVQRQGFLHEHMFARAQRGTGLVGVQRGGRDQHHGVHLRVAQQVFVLGMAALHAQFGAGPVQFGGHGAAGSHQARAGRVARQLFGVALAQPAQPGYAHSQRRFHQNSTGWPVWALCAAASASFCASTPSCTVVLKGWPLCRQAKKCSISSR